MCFVKWIYFKTFKYGYCVGGQWIGRLVGKWSVAGWLVVDGFNETRAITRFPFYIRSSFYRNELSKEFLIENVLYTFVKVNILFFSK